MKRIEAPLLIVVLIIVTIIIGRSNQQYSVEALSIGAVLPLTGGAAFIGEDYVQGMKLAAQIFDVELIVEDGSADPQKSLSAAIALEERGVDVILSAFRGASLAIGSHYGKKETGPVIFATTATSQKQPVGDFGSNFFALGAEMVSAGEVVGTHAHTMCTRVATLTETTDAGRDKVEGFVLGVGADKVIYQDTFAPDTMDFRTFILKMRGHNTNCVFIETKSNAMVVFLKQMEELGMNQYIYTNSYSLNADVVAQAPKAQIENVVFSSTKLYENSDEQKEFAQKYISIYDEDPNDFAAIGYGMVRITVKAWEECGDDRSCVREYFKNLSEDSLVGDMVMDQNQEVKLKDYVLFRVEENEFVEVR